MLDILKKVDRLYKAFISNPIFSNTLEIKVIIWAGIKQIIVLENYKQLKLEIEKEEDNTFWTITDVQISLKWETNSQPKEYSRIHSADNFKRESDLRFIVQTTLQFICNAYISESIKSLSLTK